MELNENNLFCLGTLVTRRKSAGVGKLEYFIVEGYSYDSRTDTDYLTLANVYPVYEHIPSIIMEVENVVIVAHKEEQQWKVVIDMIEKKRYNNNWVKIFDMNRFKWESHEIEDKKIETPQSTHNLSVEGMTGDIHYDKYKTTDECLDAINRLRELARCFKTNEYEHKIVILFNRLNELVEESNKKSLY